jgi:hypothetical protein
MHSSVVANSPLRAANEALKNATSEKNLMNAAKLPFKFIQQPPRHLYDLKLGEEGAVQFPSMLVDTENRCYLDPDAELQEGDDLIPFIAIYVVRSEAGFEVSIPKNAQFKYAPRKFVPEMYRNWLPVTKVTVIEKKER